MKAFQRMKGAVRSAAVAVVAGVSSVAAFAQSSGTTTPAFNDAAIMTSINGVVPVLVDIGGAVLAVVVVAWGYKMVKSFLGGR